MTDPLVPGAILKYLEENPCPDCASEYTDLTVLADNTFSVTMNHDETCPWFSGKCGGGPG